MPFKRVKVVMLATEEKAVENQICINSIQMFMWTKQHDLVAHTLVEYKETKRQHLYFLLDLGVEIKRGDWCYNILSHRLLQSAEDLPDYRFSGNKKVIASTDPSLNLPQPSLGFIKKFIEKWEDDEKIEEVEVEYEEIDINPYSPTWEQDYIKFGERHVPNMQEVLKINRKDNTITIISVKNSWDKKELIELIKTFGRDFGLYVDTVHKQEIKDWLIKNL